MDRDRSKASKPQKQQPKRDEDDARRKIQEPGQVSHPDRHGDAERQPEEPHGESEAV